MLIKQAHFFWVSRPNKRASTFPIQVGMTVQHDGGVVLLRAFRRRGEEERRRAFCLPPRARLDVPHEPFDTFVGLNFFLCYICRLRFRQTTGDMKAAALLFREDDNVQK